MDIFNFVSYNSMTKKDKAFLQFRESMQKGNKKEALQALDKLFPNTKYEPTCHCGCGCEYKCEVEDHNL